MTLSVDRIIEYGPGDTWVVVRNATGEVLRVFDGDNADARALAWIARAQDAEAELAKAGAP